MCVCVCVHPSTRSYKSRGEVGGCVCICVRVSLHVRGCVCVCIVHLSQRDFLCICLALSLVCLLCFLLFLGLTFVCVSAAGLGCALRCKTDIAVFHAVTNFKEQVSSATDINHANIHHFHENTRYASDHPRRKARVEISDTKAFIVNYRYVFL